MWQGTFFLATQHPGDAVGAEEAEEAGPHPLEGTLGQGPECSTDHPLSNVINRSI